MKNKFEKKEIIQPKIENEIRYKLLTISDNNLVLTLDAQEKQGFELVNILERINPSASSDFCGYKILLRSIRK